MDVILTNNEAAALAAKAASQQIPIVFTLVGNPVAAGVVTDLAQPGGNLTGIAGGATQIVAKRIEILRTLMPKLRRVWFIYRAGDPTDAAAVAAADQAARHLKVELLARSVESADQLKRTLLEVRPGDGLLSPEMDALDITAAILDKSLKSRVPAVFPTAHWVARGGLVSYGPDLYAQGVQAAGIVARILRGTRPQDLPDRVRRRHRSCDQSGDGATPHARRSTQDPVPRRRDPAMKLSMPRGLFRKYLVFLLILVGGLLSVSSAVELYFSYQETKHSIVQLERTRALAAASEIERYLGQIVQHLRGTMQGAINVSALGTAGIGMQAGGHSRAAAVAEQREIDFLRLLRNVPAITEVRHLDLAGKEQLRTSRLALDAVASNQDYADTPEFVEAKSKKTYISPVYFRNESEPFITIAVAPDENAAEVTGAEVNVRAIWDVVARIGTGRAGNAYVVDSTGQLIAHPDLRLVLSKRDLSDAPQVKAARAPRTGSAQEEQTFTIAEGVQGGQVLTVARGDSGARLDRVHRAPGRGHLRPAARCHGAQRRSAGVGPSAGNPGERRAGPQDGRADPPAARWRGARRQR